MKIILTVALLVACWVSFREFGFRQPDHQVPAEPTASSGDTGGDAETEEDAAAQERVPSTAGLEANPRSALEQPDFLEAKQFPGRKATPSIKARVQAAEHKQATQPSPVEIPSTQSISLEALADYRAALKRNGRIEP